MPPAIQITPINPFHTPGFLVPRSVWCPYRQWPWVCSTAWDPQRPPTDSTSRSATHRHGTPPGHAARATTHKARPFTHRHHITPHTYAASTQRTIHDYPLAPAIASARHEVTSLPSCHRLSSAASTAPTRVSSTSWRPPGPRQDATDTSGPSWGACGTS